MDWMQRWKRPDVGGRYLYSGAAAPVSAGSGNGGGNRVSQLFFFLLSFHSHIAHAATSHFVPVIPLPVISDKHFQRFFARRESDEGGCRGRGLSERYWKWELAAPRWTERRVYWLLLYRLKMAVTLDV